MEQALRRYVRLIDEHLYKLFPKQLAACKEEVERFHDKVTKVAQKFGIQYTRLIDTAQDYAADPTCRGAYTLPPLIFKSSCNRWMR